MSAFVPNFAVPKSIGGTAFAVLSETYNFAFAGGSTGNGCTVTYTTEDTARKGNFFIPKKYRTMTTTRREGGADAAVMRETLRTAAEMLAACRRMLSATAREAAVYTLTHALHRAAEGAAKALARRADGAARRMARRADGAARRMAQCENAMRWMRGAIGEAEEPQALKPYALDEDEEAAAVNAEVLVPTGESLNRSHLTSGKEVTA